MNEIQIFKNEDFGTIRTIEENGKIIFCGNDVATSLGYTNPQKALKDHCREDGVTFRSVIDSVGRTQQAKFIDEGNLYRLITHSKLPSAERFEKWVFDEVLPTIRKTGGYVSNDNLFIDTYLPFADDTTKTLFKSTLAMVRQQNELLQKQQQEIEHKDKVIIGLVDEIDLAEKRQILNRVVRYKGANYCERWRELYKQFEMKYHIGSLDAKLESYNATHKPKLRNKVDYIDKVLNKIPELYEIACKLYESDVKELVDELYRIN